MPSFYLIFESKHVLKHVFKEKAFCFLFFIQNETLSFVLIFIK